MMKFHDLKSLYFLLKKKDSKFFFKDLPVETEINFLN